MNEQELHEYTKWLMEVWNPNQLYIPFAVDAPKAYLRHKAKQLNLPPVVQQSEQLKCEHKGRRVEKVKLELMNKILEMSTADKILLLNEIRRNYTLLKKYWTVKKVEWLQTHILIELQNLGNFDLA